LAATPMTSQLACAHAPTRCQSMSDSNRHQTPPTHPRPSLSWRPASAQHYRPISHDSKTRSRQTALFEQLAACFEVSSAVRLKFSGCPCHAKYYKTAFIIVWQKRAFDNHNLQTIRLLLQFSGDALAFQFGFLKTGQPCCSLGPYLEDMGTLKTRDWKTRHHVART